MHLVVEELIRGRRSYVYVGNLRRPSEAQRGRLKAVLSDARGKVPT